MSDHKRRQMPTLLFNLGDPRLRDDERKLLLHLLAELTRRDTGIASKAEE